MNIVFFAHPAFLGHKSMNSFTAMLAGGLKRKGHLIEIWSPVPIFFKLPLGSFIKKWLGYIDQYIIFPTHVRWRLKTCYSNTLFVFTDQALSPWVFLVKHRPHVIHCHDFLALQSAMGEIPEHKTSWSGRKYQFLIHSGYAKSDNFISVSHRTKEQLSRFLLKKPVRSVVVYNGLKDVFAPVEPSKARSFLASDTGLDLSNGYILHTGGNQWYKNRPGVIELYNAWRLKSKLKHVLLLVGDQPSSKLKNVYEQSPFKTDIHFLTGKDDTFLNNAYSGASVFIFPSFAEGFGWPIAEAMACGCPVITTNDAPMTEVAGNAGFFITRHPGGRDKIKNHHWATEAAKMIDKVLAFPFEIRQSVIEAGIKNVQRFNLTKALNDIESIYLNIIEHY